MTLHYLQHLAHSTDRERILQELMEQYGQDVWNFAYFITKSREAADDVSQETFIAVFNHMFSFRGDCSMKSWLLTITRNKALSYMRSSYIRKVTLMSFISATGSVPSAESELLDQLRSKRIWTIVLELPRAYREVILLEYHYGMSMQEMAQLLHLSEGTVKSRLHRARRRISSILEGEDSYEA
ncbi:RNA polymerase sigma factor [Paenibacillus sp. GCM10023252]|uniref:RNA polymerase sigma factor n=1 Tax=Paenibacillus sp. GCM10023252 TaxID=3252649 RepID=UPI0036197A5B